MSTSDVLQPTPKIRARFGVRLPWPIANAATFVAYLSREQYERAEGAVFTLKAIFPVASSFFIEQS